MWISFINPSSKYELVINKIIENITANPLVIMVIIDPTVKSDFFVLFISHLF